ncbi:MAG: hypothetical protein AAB393_06690 [Bacteroidota bacterium]
MRAIGIVLLILAGTPALFAQDEANSEWQIMPGVAVVKFFPGENVRSSRDIYLPTYPPILPSYSEHNYSGTGISFSARCFSEDIKPLALTFGGGITWYYQPEHISFMMSPNVSGVGGVLGRQDFTAFPVSVGVQAVFPYASREKLMVFAGAEGNLHFVSGNLAVNQQAKAGYTLLGGFAVKFLEFGIRYTSFSDIKNLGAHFGLRFKSFGI